MLGLWVGGFEVGEGFTGRDRDTRMIFPDFPLPLIVFYSFNLCMI